MFSRLASIAGAVVSIRSLIAVSTIVLLSGTAVSLRPDRMLVEHVRFVGNEEATAPELRHLADLHNGTRMWEVDLERVSRGVSGHPWVRAATVRSVWPDTIEIQIEEYEPVAVLHLDRLYYVAIDGTAFVAADSSDLDYPQLTGITAELSSQHPRLPGLAVAGGLNLLETLDAAGLVALADVDELNFSTTRGFTVYTGSSEIRFAPGRTDEQVERLASLVSLGHVDLDKPTLVDLGPRSVAVIRDLTPLAEG